MRIQDLCMGGGGAERNFADVAQQSRSDQENLGLKIGGGGPG